MAKRRPQGFSPETKEMIWDRARGRCERCGLGLSRDGGGGDFHHRRPRGSGGTSLAWVNQPANGVLLCTGCHGWVESNRQDARDLGWLVSRNAVYKAEDVPLTYWDGALYLLDDFGGRESPPNRHHT